MSHARHGTRDVGAAVKAALEFCRKRIAVIAAVGVVGVAVAGCQQDDFLGTGKVISCQVAYEALYGDVAKLSPTVRGFVESRSQAQLDVGRTLYQERCTSQPA